ncbi:MAG: phosphatidylcholine/phosphatidylserine synthase [Vicinamibacterales bacterium]
MTPWLAHAYTASGAVTALMAVLALDAGDLRAAYLWLAGAVAIDATDGVLARALAVKERLPWFDGAGLDNLVDFLTYVFVPALIVVKTDLVPGEAAVPVAAAMLLSSGYGFSRTDAKVATTDHFFTGFPSYWNIVCLYLHLFRLPPAVNAAVLAVLAALVFVPVRYVYPSRTVTWRPATLALSAWWACCLLVAIWRLPATDGPWAWLSLVFPAYYVALSFVLSARERGVR